MSAIAQEPAVRVAVTADRSSAELVFSPVMHRSSVTREQCESALQHAGVEVTDAVREAVAAVLAAPMPPGEEVRQVVARTRPAIHGVDGCIEWHIDEPTEGLDEPDAGDASQSGQPAAPDGSSGGSSGGSYYDVSAFTMVQPGQVLGRIRDPRPGEDGRDVTGKTLVAREGKEHRVKLDDTIQCDEMGRLIARVAGVFIRSATAATIRNVLEVSDYVDFSTGNIDFHGDVIVSKGVRDLFTVQATGNVHVAGLIEAATIVAGQDLVAAGGFAGRERGAARCGADFTAKYIDNIHGEVARDLIVEREIINCELTVHGNVTAPKGAVIGGRLVVAGRIEVGLLGSGANVPTEIVVGSVPRLEPLCDRLGELVDRLTQRRLKLLEQQPSFADRTPGRGGPSAAGDRHDDLAAELARVEALLDKAAPTLDNLRQRIHDQRTIDVTIERKLFPGVIVTVGDDRHRIDTAVPGPVRLLRDETGMLIFHRPGDGGGGRLAQIAELLAPR